MALPANESFSGVDGTVLSTYSASWTLVSGRMAINSSALSNDDPGAGDSCYRWNADSFANGHKSTATYVHANFRRMGVAAAIDTGGAVTYYGFYGYNGGGYGERELFERNAGGAVSVLSEDTSFPTVGQVLSLEVDTNSQVAKVDGTTILSATDGTITGGAAGVCGRGSGSANGRIDDWVGDNLSGGGGPAALVTKKSLLGVGL